MRTSLSARMSAAFITLAMALTAVAIPAPSPASAATSCAAIPTATAWGTRAVAHTFIGDAVGDCSISITKTRKKSKRRGNFVTSYYRNVKGTNFVAREEGSGYVIYGVKGCLTGTNVCDTWGRF